MSITEFFESIYNYPINKTHFNGKDPHCDNMTIYDLLNYAKLPLGRIATTWSISNIKLPPTIGANSLVFYADALKPALKPASRDALEIVIKIALTPIYIVDDIDNPILIIASKNNISPQLLIEEFHYYKSTTKMISIVVSTKVIPFMLFKWINNSQKKIAIVSLLDKIFKLHRLGYVHNDIKLENIGMDPTGEISLYDFDNFGLVDPTLCDTSFSSSQCLPPVFLIEQFIKLNLGNIIIDIFPAIACILGNIINIESWQFRGLQLTKKEVCIKDFNPKTIYWNIYHELVDHERALFHGDKKDSFSLALSYFIKLFLHDSLTLTTKLFLSKANILLMQLKRAL